MAKLRCVNKEQIQIRYIGLGWEEAYHAWSKNGVTYSPAYLLEHLTKVVIPLQQTKQVPAEPPLNIPGCPKLASLGTKAQDITTNDNSCINAEEQLRNNAINEQERREADGFGDQLMEMQQTSMPKINNNLIGYLIEMLFEYNDPDGSTLRWCQGKVLSVVRESNNLVEIEWNDDCVNSNEPKITKHRLLKTKWNPQKQTSGAWRENIRHLLLLTE